MDNIKKTGRLEEFDHETYARTSDNNMPMPISYKPLSDEEEQELNEIFALKN